MFLVYNIEIKSKGTGQQKVLKTIIDSKTESILTQTQYNIIDYKFLYFESIVENIIPTRLDVEENLDILIMLRQIIQINGRDTDIIPDLKESESKKIRELAPIFSNKIKDGVNVPKILQEIKFPKFIYESLDKASGTSTIEETYTNLIKILESNLQTEAKIKKILRYPKIVFSGLIFYFLFIEMYLVPKNNVLLATLEIKEQPPFVDWIYNTSSFALENNTLFIVLTIFIAISGYKILYFLISKLSTYVPAVNKIVIYRDSSLFFNVLSMLLDANTQMYTALKNSAGLISEEKMKNSFFEISNKMKRDGGSLLAYITDEKYKFDTNIRKFTRYGDREANFGKYFRLLHKQFETKMLDQIDVTLELINPLTMLITVIIMIGLYIGVQYPLLNLSTSNF